MARNKECRPEWFKFWRRNRRQLDIDQLSMESRGIIFTNMMRYFDSGDSELLEMSPIESVLFNVVKINVDDTFSEYEQTAKQNRENALKRWNPTASDRIRANASDAEVRSQKSEVRSQKSEVKTNAAKPPHIKQFIPPTVEEIAAYCQERRNGVEAQKVFDYYAAADWKDSSGKPVRNWKQKIIAVWERKEAKETPSGPDLSWIETERR